MPGKKKVMLFDILPPGEGYGNNKCGTGQGKGLTGRNRYLETGLSPPERDLLRRRFVDLAEMV
jgi:hypothetical protein